MVFMMVYKINYLEVYWDIFKTESKSENHKNSIRLIQSQ